MVFVRSPVDRVVSVYQNKFVQRKNGATGKKILSDCRYVTGLDYGDINFGDFVSGYLSRCFNGRSYVSGARDPHIYTQKQQLLPVQYDIVESVNNFDSVMQSIGLGQLLSSRANATSGKVDIPDAFNVSSNDLHQHYLSTGETPSSNSLLGSDLKEMINSLYFEDLMFFSSYFRD